MQLPERCYTLDVAYPLMVVGCADRHIEIINLTNPSVIFKVCPLRFIVFGPVLKIDATLLTQSVQSPLKWQTRVVAAFPQANGFAIGSVEGRVAVQ